jgi:hypothetical protein
MRRIFRQLVLLGVALLALSAAAQANVTAVSGSPGTIRINPNGVNAVRVRWTVGVTTSIPVTVSSSVGQVYDGATLLASPGGLLSRQVTSAGATTVQFSETIAISRTLAKTLQTGSTIYYRRSFTDGGGTVVADLAISVTNSGEIAFRNVDLRFDTGGTYAVVQTDTPLAAEALVTLSGRGVFDAVWEVADLSSAQPNSFRPVARVRRVAAGTGRLVLSSPPLPTAQPGIYAVRLMPTGGQASLSGIFPVIRYAVTGGDADVGLLRLTMPEAGARFGADTVFGWTPVAGAGSYRVEFLRDQQVVAGIAVAAPADRTKVKSFTLAKARSGQATHWRAVAFDEGGKMIAAAPARRLSSGTDQTGRER